MHNFRCHLLFTVLTSGEEVEKKSTKKAGQTKINDQDTATEIQKEGKGLALFLNRRWPGHFSDFFDAAARFPVPFSRPVAARQREWETRETV